MINKTTVKQKQNTIDHKQRLSGLVIGLNENPADKKN